MKLGAGRLAGLAVAFAAVLFFAIASGAQEPAATAGQKTVTTPGIPATGFAGLDQYRASRIAMFTDDYGQLARYRTANEELHRSAPVQQDSVFRRFGTDGWKLKTIFPASRLNRGIGGQTTPQMLVRFRQDVIELLPEAVVI
jgi:hypothetical protein